MSRAQSSQSVPQSLGADGDRHSPGRLAAFSGEWSAASGLTSAVPLREQDPIVIEALVATDAHRCARLAAVLFAGDDPWPRPLFEAAIESPHTWFVGAWAGGLLVGYAGIARLGTQPPYEYEIHSMGVHPAWQSRGVGRRLLTELLGPYGGSRPGESVFLEVRTDNVAAIRLYQSVGFVTIGVRKRYYWVSGVDAYTMKLVQGQAPRAPRQTGSTA